MISVDVDDDRDHDGKLDGPYQCWEILPSNKGSLKMTMMMMVESGADVVSDHNDYDDDF